MEILITLLALLGIIALAHWLGVTIDELMGDDEERGE